MKLADHLVICNVNEKLGGIVREIRGDERGAELDVVVLVQDWDLWQANPDWYPPAPCGERVTYVEGCPGETASLARVCGVRLENRIRLRNRPRSS